MATCNIKTTVHAFMKYSTAIAVLFLLPQATSAVSIQRFDMFALTDFQQAAHRLQETTSRLLARKHSVPGDELGTAIASLGDIDRDGRWEFAVTAPNTDVGCGIVHIIRIDDEADAELLASNVILPNSTNMRCATSVTMVGQKEIGNTATELHLMLALGAPAYNDKGAVIISTLTKYGKVIGKDQVIQAPLLGKYARFGASVAYANDIDGDGNKDLIIGSPGESTIYVALLDKKGDALGYSKSESPRNHQDGFGSSIATLGDINNDGRAEFLVASQNAIYLLQFAVNGITRQTTALQLPAQLELNLAQGSALAFVGLDDNDDVLFSVGCRFDNDGGMEKGAVWIISMQSDGLVKSTNKLSEKEGRFSGNLDEREHFGASLAATLDINRDGYVELLIGAPRPPKWVGTPSQNAVAKYQRRGGIWVTDIPGTRAKKVSKLEWSDSPNDCIYDKDSCTCSYRSGRKSRCLSLVEVTPAGALCRERSCIDSFACGKFEPIQAHYYHNAHSIHTNQLQSTKISLSYQIVVEGKYAT